MALEKELEFYKEHLNEWLAHYEGKFAVIKGTELIGTFTKMEEAYGEGVKRFGSEAFLIKRVAKDEPTEEIPAYFLGLSNARIF